MARFTLETTTLTSVLGEEMEQDAKHGVTNSSYYKVQGVKLKSCIGAVTEAWFLNMRNIHRKKKKLSLVL